MVFCFYPPVGQTESNPPVLCCNPAAILLASKQVACPGARAEHGHLSWVLLALVNWKCSHPSSPSSLFLMVLIRVCMCISRGVGFEMLTLRVQIHIHATEGYLSSSPGCLVSALQLETFLSDGLSLCEGFTLAWLGGAGRVSW